MTVATPTSPTSPFHLSVHRILEKEQKEDHSDEYDDLESGNCKSFRESVLKVIEQNASRRSSSSWPSRACATTATSKATTSS